VPKEMVIDIKPAKLSGTPKPGCITGQATPNSESGSPKFKKTP